MTTMTFTGELQVVTCYCGIPFAVPTSLYDEHRRKKDVTITCPLGHGVTFGGDSEMKRLKDQLARERADSAQARAARDAKERQLRATKGALTKARRRAGHGVCPCCTRTFANVARHVASQHPEFVANPA